MNYLKFGNGDKTLVMIPGLSVQSVLNMGDAVKNAFKAYERYLKETAQKPSFWQRIRNAIHLKRR